MHVYTHTVYYFLVTVCVMECYYWREKNGTKKMLEPYYYMQHMIRFHFARLQ